MEPHLRRRNGITPDVDILRERRVENGAMRAIGRRNPSQARSIEPDAEDVGIDVAPGASVEVDKRARLVDAVQRANLPPPIGHLARERTIGPIVIQVLEAVSFAEPE